MARSTGSDRPPNQPDAGRLALLRDDMVDRQIAARGIGDPRVLAAMRTVPRHEFVPSRLHEQAYDDGALPIGNNQTISQPYIVALMADALAIGPDDRLLDVGTGSGYAAAVMAHLAAEVFTVERHAALLDEAVSTFERLGITNIHPRHTPDVLGWPEEAPFDAICVAAASNEIPDALAGQLAVGGRMVIPVGRLGRQQLRLVTRSDRGLHERDLGAVAFVPLVTDPASDDHNPGDQ